MKFLRCRRARSDVEFSSLNLNVIENLLNGKSRKQNDYRLIEQEEEEADEKGVKEWSKSYFPNCDPSIWMRSCEKEVIEPIDGNLTGSIPTWLKGTLLRNGPGSLKVGNYRFEHLFDSSALLHRFGISNGTVTYQRRFVQTDVYKRNMAAQRIVVTEFGTRAVPDPCQSIFQRVAAAFNPGESLSDNSMISVYPFGDEYYTFTEAPVMHRIDPDTLETMGKVNVSDYVGIVNHTSHPLVTNDGTVYNVGLSITPRGPAYNVVRFDPPRRPATSVPGEPGDEKTMFDQATIVASVTARWVLNPSYMHTFGITENYFIIVEQPLALSVLGMVSCHVKQEPLSSVLKWHEDENTLIHVVSRQTGTLERTFVAEAFFYLHIINQFETQDSDYVVLDVCCYRDAKMLDCMYVDMMKNLHKNPDYAKLFREHNLIAINAVNRTNFRLERSFRGLEDLGVHRTRGALEKRASAHRLPDGSVFVKPELLCDLGCETPRFNSDLLLGKEYRYFYAISSDVDIENPGTIIKVDTVNKTKKTWCEENAFPSEPIFVPDPNGKKEDDGVVLSVLIWSQGHETEVGLLVLDAVTFEEIGRATFDTPGPVPKCLHGWFAMEK